MEIKNTSVCRNSLHIKQHVIHKASKPHMLLHWLKLQWGLWESRWDALVIIFAPYTESNYLSRSTSGICRNWIHDLTDVVGPLSSFPQARRVVRPNIFPTGSQMSEIANSSWFIQPSHVSGICSCKNILIASHALTIPKRNLLDIKFRLGVCAFVKNIHFKEGNQLPPILGDNCISWLNSIPFQASIHGNNPLTTNFVRRAWDCIKGSIKANPH